MPPWQPQRPRSFTSALRALCGVEVVSPRPLPGIGAGYQPRELLVLAAAVHDDPANPLSFLAGRRGVMAPVWQSLQAALDHLATFPETFSLRDVPEVEAGPAALGWPLVCSLVDVHGSAAVRAWVESVWL